MNSSEFFERIITGDYLSQGTQFEQQLSSSLKQYNPLIIKLFDDLLVNGWVVASLKRFFEPLLRLVEIFWYPNTFLIKETHVVKSAKHRT